MRYAHHSDDFNSFSFTDPLVTSDVAWGVSMVGSGSLTAPASESNASGIIRLTTGSTSSDYVTMTRGSILPANVSHFTFRMRVSHTSNILVHCGLGYNVAAADLGDHGAYFEYAPASDATIHSVTRASAAEQDLDTNQAPSTTLFTGLRFVRVSASLWHSYTLSSGGILTYRASHTTNLPTNTLTLVTRVQTLTSAARFVELDFVECRSVRLSR